MRSEGPYFFTSIIKSRIPLILDGGYCMVIYIPKVKKTAKSDFNNGSRNQDNTETV